MKRLIAGTAAALLAAVLFLPVDAASISARSAIVLDAVSGRVVFEKNADERSLVASTTKIMTALLVCEQCNVLDRMRIPKEAVGIEGSSMYLKEGEVLTLQELLYGLMLSSGNDAAIALAIGCSGTVEGFVERMNDKARMLGLTGTHFENPNGLDSPGHYSTARDLAVLAAYAMDNPIFAKTVSTKNVNIGQRYLKNHNKLLWQVKGADGVKTGYTKAAGRILVSSAVRDGRRLIAVTIHAPDDWRDHSALLEEGFSRYNLQRIVTAGDRAGTVSVFGGDANHVELVAKEHFVYAIAPEERPQLLLPGKEFVYAPVAEGADGGYAYVMIGGKAVGKVPVVYGSTVEQAGSSRKGREEKSMQQRLQKILSERGIASRRKAEEMIAAGMIQVNGQTAVIGQTADPDTDEIRVEGKLLPSAGERVYIMLHKPRGYVTTLADEKGRDNAAQLVADCGTRVYPIGRLDMDSEGLLLFTNDGEFANLLMHPRHEVEKIYEVTARGYAPGKETLLARPIELDGSAIRPPKVQLVSANQDKAKFLVGIHEGKNRQVRRMCEAAGMRVTRLKRIREGALSLGMLAPGKWRYLTEEEVRKLKE